jgi:1-deoxy-D-xylulose-5-phosphate reductoisomerase
MPCILNAANEVAVQAFLEEQIGFLEIPEVVAGCMDKVPYIANPAYDDYVQSDAQARRLAGEATKLVC